MIQKSEKCSIFEVFSKFPHFLGTLKSDNFQQYTIFIFGQKMAKHGPKMAKMTIISKMAMTTVV